MADPSTDYTDADLIAIRRAISRGERSVQFADRMVQYRSIEELLQAEARIAGSLSVTTTTTTTRRARQSLITSTKGF